MLHYLRALLLIFVTHCCLFLIVWPTILFLIFYVCTSFTRKASARGSTRGLASIVVLNWNGRLLDRTAIDSRGGEVDGRPHSMKSTTEPTFAGVSQRTLP
jgi:hypothetical protein